MFRGIINSEIRRELKNRVDELLRANAETNKRIEALDAAIRGLTAELARQRSDGGTTNLIKMSENLVAFAEKERVAATVVGEALAKAVKELEAMLG